MKELHIVFMQTRQYVASYASGCFCYDVFLGVDENGCIILKYKDGAMANLTYHTSAGEGENAAVIYGDKGKIKVNIFQGLGLQSFLKVKVTLI